MRSSNYPTAKLTEEIEESPGFVTDTVQSLCQLSQKGKPQTVEELESRIDDYFHFCGEHGCRIGIEGLALSLGIDRSTFWRWSNGENGGKGERWTEICRRARQFIIAFTESTMISGKLSPPVAIFAMKNIAGWKDAISFEDAMPQGTLSKQVLSAEALPKLSVGQTEDNIFSE